uniref:Uncharacterized protein n=1 Tax=Proboscia inermis TaxID=420281 RepID=A0A7S0GBL4_9STRA|mmetsp:Transcript_16176/g.16353  ORF Transcript_16176/g.16353 Transcript_16176/m.16353 type:complete len:354 (+) Transcript_16176:61-1122(+)
MTRRKLNFFRWALLLYALSKVLPLESLTQRPPNPPYTFTNARILYQPTIIPVSAARACTAPVSDGGLKLLSLLGYTLGGVFCVEWNDSPVGYYREVAVLSGLVVRLSPKGGGLGAWASHILVTTDDAVDAGVDVFGLPAILGTVEFAAVDEENSALNGNAATVRIWHNSKRFLRDVAVAFKYAFGTAVPGVSEPAEILQRKASTVGLLDGKINHNARGFWFASDDTVIVRGWDQAGWLPPLSASTTTTTNNVKPDSGFVLNLPSFSGRLPMDALSSSDGQVSSLKTPLLRYDLNIGSARRMRLSSKMPTFVDNQKRNNMCDSLRNVLNGLCAFPCIQIDDVTVVAGAPKIVAE